MNMKSNKQRRAEIVASRAQRKVKAQTRMRAALPDPRLLLSPSGSAPCNSALLAPYNSYGVPSFVERGYYVDTPFECIGCRKQEVWRATQQKWWYEVAKGNVESTAVRCNPCRRAERERKAEARRVHLEGSRS
jgi:hypothetical protein